MWIYLLFSQGWVCVCVCVCERERERSITYVCVCFSLTQMTEILLNVICLQTCLPKSQSFLSFYQTSLWATQDAANWTFSNLTHHIYLLLHYLLSLRSQKLGSLLSPLVSSNICYWRGPSGKWKVAWSRKWPPFLRTPSFHFLDPYSKFLNDLKQNIFLPCV